MQIQQCFVTRGGEVVLDYTSKWIFSPRFSASTGATMSGMVEMKARGAGKDYSKVLTTSAHGQFSIEDEDDDNVEIQFQGGSGDDKSDTGGESQAYSPFGRAPTEDRGLLRNGLAWISHSWSILTFSWMQTLLETGNKRPLEMDDLYKLAYEDSAEGVYKKFKAGWLSELTGSSEPSLTMAFFHAFGTPFLMAAFLKLIHDSSIFVGPLLLNELINFLNDPTIPLSTGLWYVFGLFISNLIMSLCLRQYFWSCYRVGMNLRSSVVTSIYNKALAISVASLSRKTLGEITNLMSVDSSRLQDLTPYLHAVWYSLYQIAVALFFLYQQMGASCFAGMALIIVTIPLTGKVSMYLKGLQKSLSSVRDERIKLTNEVLAGMKVIKLQAWEKEFQNRIRDVRDRELEIFKKYSVAVCMSSALYTAIPLLVSILTFTSYIALGNTLDVATALTSLALFDLLRFPLFMLPMVLNNLVEAKVSVDRVQGFLLEGEKRPVSAFPLKKTGAWMHNATLVWESGVKRKPGAADALTRPPPPTWFQRLYSCLKYVGNKILVVVTCGRYGGPPMAPVVPMSSQLSVSGNPLLVRANSNSSVASAVTSPQKPAAPNAPKSAVTAAPPLSEAEFLAIVREAQVIEAEKTIAELETELAKHRGPSTFGADGEALKNDGSSPLLRASSFVDEEGAELGSEVGMRGVLSPSSVEEGRGAMSPLHTGAGAGGGAGVGASAGAGAAGATGKDARVLTLSRICLQARAGQLIAIVGPVGSGKSSVLSALLGDMRLCFGNVALYGSIAYAAQVPFIQNSTLKDNIVYGNPYDEELYQRTLQVCALLPDIKVLPAGHDTEIGERGINLSGGQKARVGLARAVYANADIYLLDDPLSAVDAHVGQHLFEECILDLKRRGKCVVLVTNALQFLKQSSHIVVLKDGRIAECGSYEELLKSGKGFTDMITTMQETGSGNLAADEEEARLEMEEGANGENGAAVEGEEGKPRARSVSSAKKRGNSIDAEADAKVNVKKAGSLTTTEDRETGDVSAQVYAKWAVAAGGISVGVLIVLLFFAGEIITLAASWWLSYWSEHRHVGSPWFYLGIYVLINCIVVAFSFVRELYVRMRALDAGRGMFLELLSSVLFSPMSFFDTTPLGRVINRFSKDVYTVDEQIPQTVRGYLGTMAKVISTILYICVITPLFIIGLIPIMGFYYVAQRYYIKTSRELSRLESTSRSPIYALFSETLDGLATIRAYGNERRLIEKNNRLLDSNVQSYFLNFSANCWLAVRLEFAGTLIVTFTALFAVLGRTPEATDGATDSVARRQAFAGLAGLAISFALSVTQSLNWTVRMASDLESQMVSVERIKSYAGMPQEAAHFLEGDPLTANTPTEYRQHHHQFRGAPGAGGVQWPTAGAIEMRAVTMRYREGLPLVLRGLTLSIAAREKVGIVGRTGAGKSSLLTALLRLVELESGSILIDRVDISKLGLNTLRSVMAVIPQDPVLFSGTIRSNLDPFGKYTDTEIWEGLQRTLLSNTIASLDDKVAENGSNFSVGQRQLLCIARALLAKAKIIIMDEATAAVDVETDAVIQQTIRTEFAHATCLTVAHRLNTIMDSDKVLVMDNGVAAEYDTPQNLLANDRSMFSALVANWESTH